MAWNTNDKAASITVSTDSTVASISGGSWASIRGVDSNDAGKRYFEIEFTSSSAFDNAMIGFADANHVLTTYLGNSNPVSFGLWSKDGSYYSSGVTGLAVEAAADYNVGDRVGVAMDLAAGSFSISVNGTEVITGTIPAGAYFPALSMQNTASATIFVDEADLLNLPLDFYPWAATISILATNLDAASRQEILVLNEDRTTDGRATIAAGTSDLQYFLPPSASGLIEFYAFDTDAARSVFKTAQLDPANIASLEFSAIFGSASESVQAAKVSGTVQIDGTPAERTVRAFGYNPTTHDIDAATVSLSKSLGHARSAADTGAYTIDLLGGYGKEVFVVAFDDYGAAFTPDLIVAVGDRVHPTTTDGHVYECTGAGALPSTEPAWVVDTETAQLYGTASMIARVFYRPMVHGPVAPEVTNAVALWTPAEMTTALWLDGNDPDTVTASNGLASEWRDKSGNLYHATQPTSSIMPSYPVALNDLSAFGFYGQRMTVPQLSSGTTLTFLIVSKMNAKTNVSLMGTANDTYLPIASDGDITTEVIRIAGSNVTASTEMLIDGKTTKVATRVEAHQGIVTGQPSLSVYKDIPNINRALEMGRGGGSPNWDMDGEIAEIVALYASATLEERQRVEGYLAHKWGIESNLPTDHPHKTTPPVIEAEQTTTEVLANHWRVFINTNGGGSYSATGEIEFRSAPGGADLCSGGNPTASSAYAVSTNAAKAFDDNISSRWLSAMGDTADAWIAYEFTDPVGPKEIAITPDTGSDINLCFADFSIQHSADGQAWTTIASYQVSGWEKGVTKTFEIQA